VAVRSEKDFTLGSSLVKHLERRDSSLAAFGLFGLVLARRRRRLERRRGSFTSGETRFVALRDLAERAALSSLAVSILGASRGASCTVAVQAVADRRMRVGNECIIVVGIQECSTSNAARTSSG
jgi:hypothetical protein